MSRYWSQGLVGRNDSSSGCRLQWMQPTARCVWDVVGLEMEMETEGVAVLALGAVAFGWRHTFCSSLHYTVQYLDRDRSYQDTFTHTSLL